jgi:hypothetical protein
MTAWKCHSHKASTGAGVFTYIVAAENTNDFAVAVELAEDPLLHVLQKKHVSYNLWVKTMRMAEHALTFFNSGWA